MVALVLTVPITKDEFTGQQQSIFKKVIAETAGVLEANVQIVNTVAIIQRRSDGIQIDLTVSADNGTQALSIVSLLTLDNINAQMSKAGFPHIQIVQPPTILTAVSGISKQPPTTPPQGTTTSLFLFPRF